MTISPGSAVPDFSLKNQHGQDVSPADLRGAPAVLVFYPWAFSGICTGELCEIRDNLGALTGARVVAISCDAMFTQRAWADQEGYQFDLLSDFWPHGEVARAFGVFEESVGVSLRGTFVIDAEGVLRWSVVNAIGEARPFHDVQQALAALG